LPEALVDARLSGSRPMASRQSACGDLARDAGVNTRAVYRHFPDKLALLALVAERGWRQLAQRLKKATVGKATRRAGAGRRQPVGFFQYRGVVEKNSPTVSHLMGGARVNLEA